MKKDEEQNALFEVWLAAYNDRLMQVAQGSPASKPRSEASSKGGEIKPDSPSGA
jgi:hypothetical protein